MQFGRIQTNFHEAIAHLFDSQNITYKAHSFEMHFSKLLLLQSIVLLNIEANWPFMSTNPQVCLSRHGIHFPLHSWQVARQNHHFLLLARCSAVLHTWTQVAPADLRCSTGAKCKAAAWSNWFTQAAKAPHAANAKDVDGCEGGAGLVYGPAATVVPLPTHWMDPSSTFVN